MHNSTKSYCFWALKPALQSWNTDRSTRDPALGMWVNTPASTPFLPSPADICFLEVTSGALGWQISFPANIVAGALPGRDSESHTATATWPSEAVTQRRLLDGYLGFRNAHQEVCMHRRIHENQYLRQK